MKVKNAAQLPQIYYGLHMVEGVAEYAPEQDGRILICENAIKEMDPTFTGKPVYVDHVAEVDLEALQKEADGYVVRSFFNQLDGKHWAEFLVVSDRGHEAIRAGWRLSNAYIPKEFGSGGKWHNVDFTKEITRAEYDHLAIVQNPRYEESIILTPEQFKAYNSQKESELKMLANSKEKVSMFNFFKRTKLENSAELEGATVVLSSGTEKTIKQLVNAAEEMEKKEKEPAKVNMDCKINVDDEEMTVNELVEKYKASKAKKNEDDEEAKKKKKAEDEKKENEDAEDAKKKEMKDKDDKKSNAHFEALKNAADNVAPTNVETSDDKVARGKSRYGSV